MIDTQSPTTGSRSARLAWRLGAILVAFYLLVAVVGTAMAIGDAEVAYDGALSVQELRDPGPTGQYLSEAAGTMTRPDASAGLLAAWSVVQLAGPAVAIAVLLLVGAPLRAAGRGDPFSGDTWRRLRAAGVLLLIAYPALEAAATAVAIVADDGGGTPRAEPHFVIGFAGFLPGLLVLALATVFRHGEELRRFEQETV